MRINSTLIQESSRIIKNQGEPLRIIENQALDLFENQFQTYSRIIENQWESASISKNQQESMRIKV